MLLIKDSMVESIREVVEGEIRKRVRLEVERKVAKIKDDLDVSVSEIVAAVSLRMLHTVNFERMGDDLKITVHLGGKG